MVDRQEKQYLLWTSILVNYAKNQKEPRSNAKSVRRWLGACYVGNVHEMTAKPVAGEWREPTGSKGANANQRNGRPAMEKMAICTTSLARLIAQEK